LQTLKRYAEQMQDRIEALPEIRRVDIVGALDREIQVNIDLYKASLAGVSLNDITQSLSTENVIMPAGQISVAGVKRSLSVTGEYASAEEMANTVVATIRGARGYLKDVAEVIDTHKEQERFARLAEKNEVTVKVRTRSGED